MKHFMYIIVTIVLVGVLSGCADYAANTNTLDADEIAEIVAERVAEDCAPIETIVEVETIVEKIVEVEAAGASSERIIPIVHINGEGHEVDEEMYIMLEFETLRYTKYQVSFISCTCRSADLNYRQVMYIELNNKDASVRSISFGEYTDADGHHYTPGTWGDSDPIPRYGDYNNIGVTYAQLEEELINGFLIGKTPEELAGISTMDDMQGVWEHVDSYAGNSVSVNNLVRAVKAIQDYQQNK